MIDTSAYRPNVGVVLFHGDGRVWMGRRAGTPEPYNWQFPQGGVDEGEELEAAAFRELREETGVRSASLLGRTADWLTYDFPAHHASSKVYKGWKGQKQIWFALRFEGADHEIDLEQHGVPEFDAWRWGALDEAPGLVVPFKRPIYETVQQTFAHFAR